MALSRETIMLRKLRKKMMRRLENPTPQEWQEDEQRAQELMRLRSQDDSEHYGPGAVFFPAQSTAAIDRYFTALGSKIKDDE